MNKTPYEDVTVNQLRQVDSEWYCWSLQAYEEAQTENHRLNQMRKPQTCVAHFHRHGEQCNNGCVLLSPIPNEERGVLTP